MSKTTWAEIAGRGPRSILPPISRQTQRSRVTITPTQLPKESESLPIACWGPPEEIDPQNTRLFAKALPPELCNISLLFRTFRTYGKIRAIAINMKRSNAVIEFEKKESAIAAKLNCIYLQSEAGTTYPARLHWGKHIERPPPVKFAPPDLTQQVNRIRQVHLSQKRGVKAVFPTRWLEIELGMEVKQDENWKSDHYAPPGLQPSLDDLGSWFSFLYRDGENCGYYPRTATSKWFTQGSAQSSLISTDSGASPRSPQTSRSEDKATSTQKSDFSTPSQRDSPNETNMIVARSPSSNASTPYKTALLGVAGSTEGSPVHLEMCERVGARKTSP